MSKKGEITLYMSDPPRCGVGNNAKGYTKAVTVKAGDTTALESVVEYDNCPAEYKDGHRVGKKYIKANCIVSDTDNSHSDTPADWITHEDIIKALPDVEFYYYPSRSNMKEKNGKSPRPKEHHIFPCDHIGTVAEYVALMKSLIEKFPALHFDEQVKSPAQLNFGVEGAEVTYVAGKKNISQLMREMTAPVQLTLFDTEEMPPAKLKSPRKKSVKSSRVIPEGSRNKTLLHRAVQLLKKYGDTDDTRRRYDDYCEKCEPPLKSSEEDTIYSNAREFYHSDIKKQPDYVEPAEYIAQKFDDLRQLDSQQCYFDPLYIEISYLPEVTSKVKDKKIARLSEYDGDRDLIRSFKFLPVEENMLLLLKHYGLELKFNQIKQSPEVWKCGERHGKLQEYYSHIRDLCDKQGLKIPVNKFDDMLLSIARRSHYNPFEDYLAECTSNYALNYNGYDFIGELCSTIITTLSENVKRKYITKFLLQIAYVSTSDDGDDTSQHFMLVLKSPQGDGKSSWLMNLLPQWARRENYVLPGRTCDLKNKDHVLEQATSLLVEWAEIAATFKKSDQEEIKAYITRKVDRLRPPYFREATDIKRRMCLCASVNDEEFLRDTTGDRRYTVIPCNEINYNHSVDLDGLWGQIYKMKSDGIPYWYDRSEIAEVQSANAEHRVKSELHYALEAVYDLFPETEPKRYVYAKEIIQNHEFAKLNTTVRATPKSVTQTLKSLGVKMKLVHKVAVFGIVMRVTCFGADKDDDDDILY